MRPGRSSVTEDLRGDAERLRIRCVPEAKRRGATVLLGASLKRKTRRDSVFGCVPAATGHSAAEDEVRTCLKAFIG